MAILTTIGRATYQEAMSTQAIHLAWGAGDPSWAGSPPSEDPAATALVDELGRLEALEVAFVTPDVGGSIVTPSGNAYTASVEPTRYLFMDFHFAFVDEPTATIREVGVFAGTLREVGVSESQKYLLPAEVADPGSLLLVENLTPEIIRSIGVRERFKYVLTL